MDTGTREGDAIIAEARSEVDRAAQWAAMAWGRELRDVRPLRGGWTSTMLGLRSAGGERAALRLMTREPWRTHARGLLEREAAVQRQLRDSAVAAPVSLALDAAGLEAGTPAHLMSWLPGSLELSRFDEGVAGPLARTLHTIHRTDPGEGRPRDYQSWATPAKRVVPSWARSTDVWLEAFAVLAAPPPAFRPAFIHRDFHLGNVLWSGGEVTGVVDWVETSWGPAELDVAHASTSLAMLHGPAAARTFVAAYRCLEGTGGRDAPDDWRYWHVMDVVGYLPDPAKVVQPWRDVGRDISDGTARARLEQHLAGLLNG